VEIGAPPARLFIALVQLELVVLVKVNLVLGVVLRGDLVGGDGVAVRGGSAVGLWRPSVVVVGGGDVAFAKVRAQIVSIISVIILIMVLVFVLGVSFGVLVMVLARRRRRRVVVVIVIIIVVVVMVTIIIVIMIMFFVPMTTMAVSAR
jgi:hypothetical protein